MTDEVEVQNSVPVCPHSEQATTCRKCKDAARKRNERSKVKQQKEQSAQSTAETQMPTQEWWNLNRSKLTEAQNAELAARQETVLDTLHWMQAWTKGTYNVDPSATDYYVGLEEGTADMEADIAKFDATYCFDTASMHTEIFRTSPTFRETIKDYGRAIFNGENATEIWLKYGYLVAVPSQLACDLGMKSHKWHNQCQRCGKTTVVGSPRELVADYYCEDCEAKRKAKADAELTRIRQGQRQALTTAKSSDELYDKFGRTKDAG
jgi:hypothetical protein